jgi:urease accessory protein
MNACQPPAHELTSATWPAQLRLRFEHREALGSRLVESRHHGPLRVQRPFYPEGPDCAHVYLLHPPGGLVSGDDLSIGIHAAARAQALITTPGAGRIYRARENYLPARQWQRIDLSVDAQGMLEWLPQPTIVFDGADVALDLHVDLAADATFIGWETLCLGRPASALPFLRGRIEQRWRVLRAGVPLLNDRLRIEGGDALCEARWGLRGAPVYGTLLAVPPANRPIDVQTIDTLREQVDAAGASDELALTRVRGMLIARYLGASTERAHTLFDLCWRTLRPLLNGRKAVRPRIWNT